MSNAFTREEAAAAVHWYIPLPEAIRPPNDQIRNTRYEDLPIEGTETLTVSLYPRFVETTMPSPNEFDIAMQALRQSIPNNLQPPVDRSHDEPRVPWHSTVIEAVAIFHDTLAPSEKAISDAFDHALEQIRQLQRAFYVATKYPTPLVTREQLPSFVPQLRRIVRASNSGFPGQEGIFLVHFNTARGSTFTEPLTDTEERSFRAVLQAPDRPFFDYADLRRDAVVALEYYGNYRDAVLTAATASEVLLDTLLICLDWEDQRTPEEAAQQFQDARMISSRVKALYDRRLKGRWEIGGSGPIATWYKDTMLLRNRIVHGGFSPSSELAQKAIDGVALLESFVTDQLTKPQILSSYLHTAYSLVGYPGLERRNLLSKRRLEVLEPIIEDSDWSDRLTRYRTAVAMDRERRDDALPAPDVASARLQLIVNPDANRSWALWSKETGLAAEVLEAEALSTLSDESRENLDSHREQFEREAKEQAIVVDVKRNSGPVVQGEWVLEYHLIPTLSVMRAYEGDSTLKG
ncbi:hypothetical protein [Gulosibacter molinativorax]|nr:hypothetical protein [Gulosibacter molinativorax]QUY62382.1 Hypotetical protein [Gulosibacter molinativorax]